MPNFLMTISPAYLIHGSGSSRGLNLAISERRWKTTGSMQSNCMSAYTRAMSECSSFGLRGIRSIPLPNHSPIYHFTTGVLNSTSLLIQKNERYNFKLARRGFSKGSHVKRIRTHFVCQGDSFGDTNLSLSHAAWYAGAQVQTGTSTNFMPRLEALRVTSRRELSLAC